MVQGTVEPTQESTVKHPETQMVKPSPHDKSESTTPQNTQITEALKLSRKMEVQQNRIWLNLTDQNTEKYNRDEIASALKIFFPNIRKWAETIIGPEIKFVLDKLEPNGRITQDSFAEAAENTYKNMQFPYGKIRQIETQAFREDKQAHYYAWCDVELLPRTLGNSKEWRAYLAYNTQTAKDVDMLINSTFDNPAMFNNNWNYKGFQDTKQNGEKLKRTKVYIYGLAL